MNPQDTTPEPSKQQTTPQTQNPTQPAIQPAASAQSRHGFDKIDPIKQKKNVLWLYLLAFLSYGAMIVSLVTFNSASVYSYAGILTGGIAGLSGYRTGSKALTIFGYIPFGVNAAILLITQFI